MLSHKLSVSNNYTKGQLLALVYYKLSLNLEWFLHFTVTTVTLIIFKNAHQSLTVNCVFLSCKSRNLNLTWHTKWNASQTHCCCCYFTYPPEKELTKNVLKEEACKKELEGDWMHLLSSTFKVHQSDFFCLQAKSELLTGWGFLSVQGELLDASRPCCE